MTNLLQSGVASAERVFELLDADEQVPDAAPAGSARRRRQGTGRARQRLVPLRARQAADRGLRPGCRAGRDGGHRRPHRRRQDDARQPADALLRDRLGPRSTSTASTPRADPRELREHVRHGAAGHLAVRRHRPRTTSPTARRAPPTSEVGRRRQGGPRRPLRADPARGLRHRARRGGRQRLRGRAAAAHHRPRLPRRPGHPHPGRGHQLGGHPDRGAHPAGDGAAAPGPHQLRDRPPALHHPRRGRDPGHERRADRGAGHPRRADGAPRLLPRPLREPVRQRPGGGGE